jgi:serine/threonine-protein kinase
VEITIAELSVTGPVRKQNEDRVGTLTLAGEEERRSRGSFAAVADGVAGSGRGADASRTAIETALKTFREAPSDAEPRQILSDIFSAANLAIYDAGMRDREGGRGATTLTVAIFRYNEISVGHVGDCRAYVIQGSTIHRLTTDHSNAGAQVKMGLLSDEEAMKSKSRYMLARSLGRDPFVKVDYTSTVVGPGNYVLLCSDGVHGCVTEGEMLEAVARYAPPEACRHLVSLAEKRGADDNISVVIARIDRVEKVAYYRGKPYYPKDQPPALQVESEVGKVLDNRFELTSVISDGGMARVYRGIDRSSGQTVAVKIPFMKYESDAGSFSRFEREEKIGALLNHPSILRVVPAPGKSRLYLVTEYLEGQTLSELLAQVKVLPLDDAVRIMSRILEAVEYMHEQGVVHRDLKPQNIMVCNDGSLRIMDFGIAKEADGRKISFSGFSPTMGTPDYMAPEQVRGQGGDVQTDIYSLGAILYEMTTGSVPYQGDNAFIVMNARLSGDPVAPRKLRPEIPAALEEIILHAMERDPGNRFLSVTGFKSDLDHPDLVKITGRAERLRPPKPWHSHWRRVRVGVFAVLFILGVFGLIYLVSHAEKTKVKPRAPNYRGGR